MPSDVTIVLAPAGPGPDQIRSVLERLSQFAVLSPANLFWIAGADESYRLGQARKWEKTPSVQDDLALLRCESASFIAVELSLAAATYVDESLNFDDVRNRSGNIRLPPGLSAGQWRLVVPRDGHDRFPESPLAGWTTVVATPENRFSDLHPPADLKVKTDGSPGDYFGHAAAHIATLAGLWRNDNADFYQAGFGQINNDAAFTQRVFSRSVVGIDLGKELIEPLLDAEVRQWPTPKSPERSGADPVAHPSPPQLVASAIQVLGQDPTFRYSGPAPYQTPQRTRISIFDALRIFWGRLRGAVADLPHVFAAEAKDRLEQTANSLTTTLTGIGGAGSSVTLSADRVAAHEYGSPAEMLERVGAPVFVQSTPSTWRGLRSLCFGLIDGDPHSQAAEVSTVEGRRTVITDPRLIAPPPRHPCDPRGARLPPVAESSDDDQDRSPSPPAGAASTEETGQTQSLLWQLGAGILAEELRATADFVSAFNILATPKSESPEMQRATKQLRRLRRWGRVGAVVALVSLAYACYRTIDQYRRGTLIVAEDLADVTVATWLTIAAVVGMLIGLILYIREELRIRFRLDEYHRRLQWAQSALKPALTEVHRLDNIYAQYLDWSSIIASVIHRPWGAADPEEAIWERPHFGPNELPHSVMVVYGSAQEASDSRLRVGVEGELTQVGWLGRTYHEVSTEALEMHAIEQRRVNDDRSDPDEDVPTAPNGSRSWLAAEFIDGTAARLARKRGRRSATSFLLNLDPVETLPDLEPGWHRPELLAGLSTSDLLREQVNQTPPPLDQTLFTPRGQQQGSRDVVDTGSFLPPPLRADESRIETDDSSTDLTLVSVRVDLSGSTPKRDYTMFAPAIDPTAIIDLDAPAPRLSGDGSRQPDSPI